MPRCAWYSADERGGCVLADGHAGDCAFDPIARPIPARAWRARKAMLSGYHADPCPGWHETHGLCIGPRGHAGRCTFHRWRRLLPGTGQELLLAGWGTWVPCASDRADDEFDEGVARDVRMDSIEEYENRRADDPDGLKLAALRASEREHRRARG